MSRTHKDRHKWKNKERNRTNNGDPTKIKLHRERFLSRVEQMTMIQNGGYKPIIFRARLKVVVDEGTSELWLNDEKISDLPFIVDDPKSCHYVLAGQKPDFDPDIEQRALSEHVQRVKYLGQNCHLMRPDGETKMCYSIVDCPYRRWAANEAVAKCTL